MKRFLTIAGLVSAVFVALLITSNVSAHVLIKSTDASKAAILHVMPDDDPIAGQVATLMFDTQGQLLSGDAKVTLTIQNQTTKTSMQVPVAVDGSLVSSKYTFPSQGTYRITYVVEADDRQVTFEQTMRVSRGVVSDNVPQTNYAWAEAMLFIATVFILVLAIIGWNHRKAIFKSSVL